jgi:hypothetical protein
VNTSWHHTPNMWKRSEMVTWPCSKACFTSERRCPIRASVSIATACRTCEVSGCDRNVFAWILTVRLSKFDKFGSWAAKALKSTGGRIGTMGGRSYPSATAGSSTSISFPQPTASCYWEVSRRLLRTLMFTGKQNSTHTN